MARTRAIRQKIVNELLYEIGKTWFSGDFNVSAFADSHSLSRQSIYRYLSALEFENKVKKPQGKDGYRLVDSNFRFSYQLAGLQEGIVWSKDIAPLLVDMPETAFRSCTYVFCEMLNNAIDHSEGKEVEIFVSLNAFSVSFHIVDDGVGIFGKIASAMNFEDKRHSILELAKGKFTTDPESHSGEGIFFSAKASDIFLIYSDDIVFSSVNFGDVEHDRIHDYKKPRQNGTTVSFVVFRDHSVTTKELFDHYTEEPDHYGFTKTIVPVRMLEYGEHRPVFVSRSQAKRLLARFENFERIELDFSGIDEIGQGFADEVFRVFTNQHPSSHIVAINCNQPVKRMIDHVKEKTQSHTG